MNESGRQKRNAYMRDYLREKARRFKEAGLCGTCGSQPVPGRKMCQACLEKMAARRKRWKDRGICRECKKAPIREPGAMTCEACALANRDYLRDLSRRRAEAGRCKQCGKEPRPGRKLCGECHEVRRRSTLKVKLEVMEKYGGARCNCCGESELLFLQMDHLNGNGNQHRKQEKIVTMFRWLKKKGFPPGFQVLCANCNYGKRMTGGECPHRLNTKDS